MHGLVTGQDPRQRLGDLELKLENPLGFFESACLVEINDGLLQLLGCRWDRPPLFPASWDNSPLLDALQKQRPRLAAYALDNAWVDKDPRLCITYPAYLYILLRRIPLVVAFREPLAVATSLHARNGFSLNRGLVLWWVYNHHIASQLCESDLLVSYSSLLTLDYQSLQRIVGPFLEFHKHRMPSDDTARALIESLLEPQFNRAEHALSSESRGRVHPLLLEICEYTYKVITQSGDQLSSFQEHFNSMPRVLLECSARDRLLSETDNSFNYHRLHSIQSEMLDVSSCLKERESECASLVDQLRLLRSSHSWKITAPLRAFGDSFRHALRRR